MLYTIARCKNQGSNNMTGKWTKPDQKYILNRGTEVFIDALHNGQMQEPRFKQCDKRMDQTGSEIYIWIEVQVFIDALHNRYKGLSK